VQNKIQSGEVAKAARLKFVARQKRKAHNSKLEELVEAKRRKKQK